MNQTPDLERLSLASSILGAGIPETEKDDVPVEVSEVLRQAGIQMRNMPACLKDLAEAKKEFTVLDQSIDRLLTLAGEAAELPEHDQAGRDTRQAEFVELARVVARLAGRRNYDRPDLSLKTRPQARAAGLTLKHLVPVKTDMEAKLKEQENHIAEAIEATLNFLEVIARSYPRVSSLSFIPDLIERASLTPRHGSH
ncbi:MAG: hypothetical protein SV487_10240 [Thermodesulfobacteriota bacterium]|nr:hypothetical protein [Thermodesulfobacteriota bacterium]